MTSPHSVLDRVDTSNDDIVHWVCYLAGCKGDFSVCGAPRLDRRILEGKGNCPECKKLKAEGKHV